MRLSILLAPVAVSAVMWGQSMVEFGAGAAAGTVGGASGKSVSEGISSIFGKVSQHTEKAAKKEDTPTLKVGKAVVKSDSSVPAPPGSSEHVSAHRASTAPVEHSAPPFPKARLADALPPEPLPPPPSMTAESLKLIQSGTSRADVLKMGEPSSRVTMDQDGHLVELYSYHSNGQWFGRVRVVDGAVASVEAH